MESSSHSRLEQPPTSTSAPIVPSKNPPSSQSATTTAQAKPITTSTPPPSSRSPPSTTSTPVFGSPSTPPSTSPSEPPPRPPSHPYLRSPTDSPSLFPCDTRTHDPITAPKRSALHPTESEIPHLKRTHTTEGYRAGISAGKSDPPTAQAGFDEGYPVGGAVGVRAGFVLGCLEGLGIEGPDEEAGRELEVVRLAEEGGLDRLDEGNVLGRWLERVERLGRERGVELGFAGREV